MNKAAAISNPNTAFIFELLPTATGTHMTYICSLKPQISVPKPADVKLAMIKSELNKLKIKEAYERIGQLVMQEK